METCCTFCGAEGDLPDWVEDTTVKCGKCGESFVARSQTEAAARLLRCPSCGCQLKCPEGLAGGTARCGKCHTPVVISTSLTGGIPFACPFCDEHYTVSAELVGKAIRCKECGELSRVAGQQPRTVPTAGASQIDPGLRRKTIFAMTGALLAASLLVVALTVSLTARRPVAEQAVVVQPTLDDRHAEAERRAREELLAQQRLVTAQQAEQRARTEAERRRLEEERHKLEQERLGLADERVRRERSLLEEQRRQEQQTEEKARQQALERQLAAAERKAASDRAVKRIQDYYNETRRLDYLAGHPPYKHIQVDMALDTLKVIHGSYVKKTLTKEKVRSLVNGSGQDESRELVFLAKIGADWIPEYTDLPNHDTTIREAWEAFVQLVTEMVQKGEMMGPDDQQSVKNPFGGR